MPGAIPPAAILPADRPDAIRAAAEALRAGRLVAFPTETVYGLGADASSEAAATAIYAAKGRPSHNPLIVHLPDAAAAAQFGKLDARARLLAAAFWPGPLTLVVPRAAEGRLAACVTAGLPTVALRVPAHPVALSLLEAAGLPLAAPSANVSGRVSATTAQHVAETLGDKIAVILDGGPAQVGVESTIVGLTGPRAVLLRPGGVPREAIEAQIGPLDAPEASVVAAPGMLASHYAPHCPLRLDVATPRADEALLAFGPDVPQGAKVTLNLSPRGDLAEAAANLYAYLRVLDRADIAAIAVMPVPGHGLGLAINDRLRRAAAPRGE